MNRKEIIMKMRTASLLLGKRPAVVSVYRNFGGVKDKGGLYVMSVKDEDTLVFQNLSSLLKVYRPEENFELKLDEIKSYSLDYKTPLLGSLFIFTKSKKFLPIYFSCGIPDAHESEVNINYLVKMFMERKIMSEGVKRDEENKD